MLIGHTSTIHHDKPILSTILRSTPHPDPHLVEFDLMNPVRRVAVIGAGPSGLASVK